MAVIDKKNFLGGLNQDTEQRLLPQGDYRDALNIRAAESEGDDVGSVENIKGFEQIINDAAPGANPLDYQCIGSYQDKPMDRIIYFVADIANSEHSIYEYSLKTNNITLLLNSSFLNFQTSHFITGIKVIGHRESFAPEGILYWTDNLNPPRKMNIASAKLTTGTASISGTNGDLYTSLTSDFSFSGVDSTLGLYQNITLDSFNEYFNLIKMPPTSMPIIAPTTDPNYKDNKIYGKVIQFAYRYVYNDNEISAFSPHSLVSKSYNYDPTLNFSGDMISLFNMITVLVETGPEDVKNVQIASRILLKDEGERFVSERGWAIVADIDLEKEGLAPGSSYSYNFYNNEAVELLPPHEVAKLFDDVPLKAKSLDVVDGGRLVLGNVTNGYDVKEKADVQLGHVFADDDLPADFDYQDNAVVDIQYNTSNQWVPSVWNIHTNRIRFVFSDVLGDTVNVDINASGNYENSGYTEAGCWANGCNNCQDDTVGYSSKIDYNIEYTQQYTGLGNAGKTGAELALDFYNNFSNATAADIIVGGNNRQGNTTNWCGAGIPNYIETPGSSNSLHYNQQGDWSSYTFTGSGDSFNDIISAIPLANGPVNSYADWQSTTQVNQPPNDFSGYVAPFTFFNSHPDCPVWIEFASSNIVDFYFVTYQVIPASCCESFFGPCTQTVDTEVFNVTGYFDFLSGGQNTLFQTGFKSGATHNFGLVYYDKFNRSSAVMVDNDNSFDAYVPSWAERGINPGQANYPAYINWSINHEPPEWATHYQWVYAGNDLMEEFVQCATLGIYEGTAFFPLNSHPLHGKYLVDLSELYKHELEKESPNFGWNFKKGDRIRFLLQENSFGTEVGESFTTGLNPGATLEFQILGITGQGEYKDLFKDEEFQGQAANSTDIGSFFPNSGDQLHLTEDIVNPDGSTNSVNRFKNTSRFAIIEGAWLDINVSEASTGITYGKDAQEPFAMGSYIEVFRPKVRREQEDVFYYEFGHRYEIIEDANGARAHGGEINQLIGVGPATGRFQNGDVYLRHRGPNRDSLFATFVEDYNLSDYFDSDFWDRGRPNRIDEQYKQVERYATIYYSEPFIPNTNINGISTFNSSGLVDFPFEEYNRAYGSIQKLFAKDESLIIFQEDKVSRAVVERNILFNADGSGSLASSNKVLSSAIPYSGEYGIGFHPESFAEYAGRIYFYDLDRGAALRLSQNGLTPISNFFMKDYFGDKSQTIKKYDTTIKIHGVYDVKKEEYILSFGGIYELSPVDLCALASMGEFVYSELVSTQQLDDDGELVFDADGEPVIITTEEPINYEIGSVVEFNGSFYTQTCIDGTEANNYDEPGVNSVCWELCTPSVGCTDPAAYNYDPLALVDDGSCEYPCANLIDASEIDAIVQNGSFFVQPETVVYSQDLGITNSVGYEAQADGSFGLNLVGNSPFYVIVLDEGEDIVFSDIDNNGVVFLDGLQSGNYTVLFIPNDIASTPDLVEGMPLFAGQTLSDLYQTLTDDGLDEAAAAVLENIYYYLYYCGSSIEVEVPLSGCTDPTSFNYVEEATIDDGGCIDEITGCSDPSALNYYCDEFPVLCSFYDANNPGWTITDDGSCEYPIPGCTDPAADNYNPLATIDDGSCTYCSSLFIPPIPVTDVTSYGGADGSFSLASASGGTPPYTIEYFASDGTTPVNNNAVTAGTYVVVVTDDAGCTESTNVFVSEPAPTLGCTDPGALNYDSTADIDNGSCVYCPTNGFGVEFAQTPMATVGDPITVEISFISNAINSQFDNTSVTITDSFGNNHYTNTTIGDFSSEPNVTIPIPTGSFSALIEVTDGLYAGCQELVVFTISDFTCQSNDYQDSPQFFDNSLAQTLQEGFNTMIGWNNFSPSVNGGNKGIFNSCDGIGGFFIDFNPLTSYGTAFGNNSGFMDAAAFWQNSDIVVYNSSSYVMNSSTFTALYDPSNHNNSGLGGLASSGIIDIDEEPILNNGVVDRINVGELAVGDYIIVWNYYDNAGNLICSEAISNIEINCSGCTDDGTSPTNSPLYYPHQGTVLSTAADNYNPDANIDDGSCLYTIYACTDPLSDTYGQNCGYITTNGASGINYSNYGFGAYNNIIDVPSITLFDDPSCNGTCLYLGCTDPAAGNYDANANTDDGSCYYLGCTDPAAFNYDPNATQDDGSCLYCTDPLATATLTIDVNYTTTGNEVVITVTGAGPYTINVIGASSYQFNASLPMNGGTHTETLVNVPISPYITSIQPNAVQYEDCPAYSGGSFAIFTVGGCFEIENIAPNSPAQSPFVITPAGSAQGFIYSENMNGTPSQDENVVGIPINFIDGTFGGIAPNNYFTGIYGLGYTLTHIELSSYNGSISVHRRVNEPPGGPPPPLSASWVYETQAGPLINNVEDLGLGGSFPNELLFDDDYGFAPATHPVPSGFTSLWVLIPSDASSNQNNPVGRFAASYTFVDAQGDTLICKLDLSFYNNLRHAYENPTSNHDGLYTGSYGIIVGDYLNNETVVFDAATDVPSFNSTQNYVLVHNSIGYGAQAPENFLGFFNFNVADAQQFFNSAT